MGLLAGWLLIKGPGYIPDDMDTHAPTRTHTHTHGGIHVHTHTCSYIRLYIIYVGVMLNMLCCVI